MKKIGSNRRRDYYIKPPVAYFACFSIERWLNVYSFSFRFTAFDDVITDTGTLIVAHYEYEYGFVCTNGDTYNVHRSVRRLLLNWF